jgi:hypothetical protein
MNDRPGKPVRLVDLPGEENHGQVALLIRSAREAPEEDTPLVKWRIRSTLRRQVEHRSRVLRFALVGAFMFLAGGVVGAAIQPFLLSRPRATVSSPTNASAPAAARQGARKRALPPGQAVEATAGQELAGAETEAIAGEQPDEAVATQPPAPPLAQTAISPEPAAPLASTPTAPATVTRSLPAPRRLAVNHLHAPPLAKPSERPAPVLEPVPLAPPAAPATPAPRAPAARPLAAPPPDEQVLITTALHKLRTTREPEAALAALDAYAARFPTGVLAPEAARLRTEALLLLGRKSAVLAELDKPPSDQTPSGEERLVLRGELRAAAGRWQAAFADFDSVVRSRPAGESGSGETGDRRPRDRLERALWGRAFARSHLGDDRGARADLREYLRRFPRGRFAAEAARLLGERH